MTNLCLGKIQSRQGMRHRKKSWKRRVRRFTRKQVSRSMQGLGFDSPSQRPRELGVV